MFPTYGLGLISAGQPGSDTVPTLSSLLLSPSQPTTNQDCGATITYQDGDNDSPLSATLEVTDADSNVKIYDLTSDATNYVNGVQYKGNIPAGKLAVGTAQCVATFVNANGYAQSTNTIVVTAESVLSTIIDEFDIVHTLLEDKAEHNYQLIKNSQGVGAINREQVRRYKPTEDYQLPCVWVEGVDLEQKCSDSYSDCEDLSVQYYSAVFDVIIGATHRSEITYNSGNYKGWEAVKLLADVSNRILKENKSYTDPNNSNLTIRNTTMVTKNQLDLGELTRISKDAIGYRLTYTATIRVKR